MRITIKGLTDSTISFNTLGIILRGNSTKPELYPSSVVRHITIQTDEQMREVIGMKNAGLIAVEVEDRPVAPVAPVEAPKPVEAPADVPKPRLMKSLKDKKAMLEAKNFKSLKEIKEIKESKTVKPIRDSKAKPIKPIRESREENLNSGEDGVEDNIEDRITVISENGPVNIRARNKMSGDIPDGERTRASIDALKQMEEEEKIENSVFIDEDSLPEQDRMGGKAVFATGDKSFAKTNMKNSILPEAETVRKSVKFIELKDEETVKKEDDKSKNAFVDDEKDEGKDDLIET